MYIIEPTRRAPTIVVLCCAYRCLCLCLCLCLCVDVYNYTRRDAPLAWRAPETYVECPSGKGQAVLAASDVWMLGGTILEVLTGCQRWPYDWLTDKYALITFRTHASSRTISPLAVRRCQTTTCCHVSRFCCRSRGVIKRSRSCVVTVCGW